MIKEIRGHAIFLRDLYDHYPGRGKRGVEIIFSLEWHTFY